MAEGKLTEGRLLEAAGDVIFRRGEDYVRYVRDIRVVGKRAQASIHAKNVYAVELGWSSRDLAASCTCPHFANGFFCKHLVALGLAVIDQARQRAPAKQAVREDTVDEFLRVRSAAGGAPEMSAALVKTVSSTLNVRGFIDYRRSFDVALEAQRALDTLDEYFDVGAAELIRPALLKALTRLRSITLQADDSSGSIGEASQRAADMYARACREGSPDTIKLARWLAKFRDESPGWPETLLADFVDAFDDRGLFAYRKAVEKLDEKYARVAHRFEINRMLLELADHDGDVDQAIAVLTEGENPEFRGIVDRLRDAGREPEALVWTDRAVAAGRISNSHGKASYWLDPAEVADRFLGVGRPADAIEVLRSNFIRAPGLASYRLLSRFAESLGIGGDERVWALAKARELAREFTFSNGAVLVELAMAEGDLDAAWAAAEQFGPGHQWRRLGAASEVHRPRQAADLYLGDIGNKLRYPNSPIYPEIAATLARMKILYERAGDADDFAALMSRIRKDYSRRPALMKALDNRGL